LGSGKSELFYKDFSSLTEDLIASLPFSTATIESNGVNIASGKFGKPIPVQVREPINANLTVNSLGKKSEPFPISLSGSEQLEFKYSDTRGLSTIPFKNDPNGFGNSFKRMIWDGNSKANVAVKATPSASVQDHLEVLVSMRGSEQEIREQKIFTRRPGFVIASLKPSDASQNQAILISDVAFLPHTHFPVLQFPRVPWKQANQWRSEEVDLDVWVADKAPEKAFKVKLKRGDQVEVLDRRFSCVRNGNSIIVTYQGNQAEQVFVLCNKAFRSTHEYLDGKERKAMFEVPETEESVDGVEVCIVKQSDLGKWVADRTLEHLSVTELRFSK